MFIKNLIVISPQVQPMRSVPVHPDVKLVKLPFYDVHAELLRPATLIAQVRYSVVTSHSLKGKTLLLYKLEWHKPVLS